VTHHHALPWRTDGPLGRCIVSVHVNVETGAETVTLIGVMDSPILANEAVTAHNERRRRLLDAASPAK
jgi:hypothetical protein